MKGLIDSYLHWLKDGLILRELGNGWHELTTPFLNHNNDMIELFLRKEKNNIVISDGGATLNELSLSGVDFSRSKKRQEELNTILRSFGITLNSKNELTVSTDVEKFPEVKHRFIQTVLSIDDMFMLSSPKVENFFTDDITIFFELNEVIFVKDTSFIGKSGFSHKFDFTLPKIKQRKEIAIKAINSPRKDKIGNLLWMVQDTKLVRPETEGLLIMNDDVPIAQDIHQALKEYEIPYFLWSQKQECLEYINRA